MEKFEVHILGCGSALPTLHHNATSQVVCVRNKMLMIDCGEGTQMQLRKSRVKFTDINNIFISHLHGDHCYGLVGLISTFGLLGRIAPLFVYATEEFGPVLEMLLNTFCTNLSFKVVFKPINTKKSEVLYEDRSLTVTTIPLNHRIPCCGFLIKEKPTLPHIRRDMIDFYNIPLWAINNIKAGRDWITPEGETIPYTKLTTPGSGSRAFAYCSDTAYLPSLHKLIEGATTLYHESTYGEDNVVNAKKYYHSTAKQAAKVAKAAKVDKLIIGHYSSRYKDEEILLDEAKSVFKNTFLAEENAVFDV